MLTLSTQPDDDLSNNEMIGEHTMRGTRYLRIFGAPERSSGRQHGNDDFLGIVRQIISPTLCTWIRNASLG